MSESGEENTAFEFEGRWQDFVPIGITNALLTLVTLGFYRFWATTRERRYLWSKTRFIDDRLEWTGTGLELFIGFIAAFFLLGIPLFILQLIAQGLIFQGQAMVAGIAGIVVYLFLLCLAGFAVFRGLRYRLSRSYWHGIHGGSDNPGFAYGWSYLWKTIVGFIALGLLIPWSSTNLWKERWEAMSFGPHTFRSDPSWRPLIRRFALFYIAPLLFAGLGIWAGFSQNFEIGTNATDGSAMAAGFFIILFFLVLYIGLPVIALIYYSAYMREVISSLHLSTLSFSFEARSKDWLLLMLGNLGLSVLALIIGFTGASIFGGIAALGAIGTGGLGGLGFGTIALIALSFILPLMLVGPFVRYRNWAFFIRHLEAGGEINLDALTQSPTRELKQGEGLLDAFDMGAI
jgi:uncharacterized membrane protein YjgN (DUF898 family)